MVLAATSKPESLRALCDRVMGPIQPVGHFASGDRQIPVGNMADQSASPCDPRTFGRACQFLFVNFVPVRLFDRRPPSRRPPSGRAYQSAASQLRTRGRASWLTTWKHDSAGLSLPLKQSCQRGLAHTPYPARAGPLCPSMRYER